MTECIYHGKTTNRIDDLEKKMKHWRQCIKDLDDEIEKAVNDNASRHYINELYDQQDKYYRYISRQRSDSTDHKIEMIRISEHI